ncbi:MAG TPA: hypothetical protein VHT51_18440 [Micropepsaceae bacterium]|nr:hypothetical protein [Micropepsaceae bacterium]
MSETLTPVEWLKNKPLQTKASVNGTKIASEWATVWAGEEI